MSINIADLKKKIIYRSKYRGSKEMDSLLASFTKKYINDLNEINLLELSKMLEIDDENLFKLNKNIDTKINIDDNYVTRLFRKFKLSI